VKVANYLKHGLYNSRVSECS